jgi:hypothetical protein
MLLLLLLQSTNEKNENNCLDCSTKKCMLILICRLFQLYCVFITNTPLVVLGNVLSSFIFMCTGSHTTANVSFLSFGFRFFFFSFLKWGLYPSSQI